jgi:hypothetical protein
MLNTKKTGITPTLMSITPKLSTTELRMRTDFSNSKREMAQKLKKKTFTTTKLWDRERRRNFTMELCSKPDTRLTPRTTTRSSLSRTATGTRLKKNIKNN